MLNILKFMELVLIFLLAEIYSLNFEEEGLFLKAYNSLNQCIFNT